MVRVQRGGALELGPGLLQELRLLLGVRLVAGLFLEAQTLGEMIGGLHLRVLVVAPEIGVRGAPVAQRASELRGRRDGEPQGQNGNGEQLLEGVHDRFVSFGEISQLLLYESRGEFVKAHRANSSKSATSGARRTSRAR